MSIRDALSGPLLAMTAYRQFIVYRVEPDLSRPGKTNKYPVNTATGVCPADAQDSSIWLDAETAVMIAEVWGEPYGVGFVFTENDPFFFFDMDSALQGGSWTPTATGMCSTFAGCAIEVSRSMTGLHAFGTYTGAAPDHKKKNAAYGLELYTAKRFAALTGTGAVGNAATDATAVLAQVIEQYFKPDEVLADRVTHGGPVAEWRGPTDDDELIRRFLDARPTAGQSFNGEATNRQLWEAEESAMLVSYSDGAGGWDSSKADMGLAQRLAFWTGCDRERIETLMRQSALLRDKWDSMRPEGSYIACTIAFACARQQEVYQEKETAQGVGANLSHALTLREGDGFMLPEAQIDHFKGCVYISNQHRALIPGGHILRPEAFKVLYGGYTFTTDQRREKTTKDAWEAWSMSQVLVCPKVNGTCFKPNLPETAIIQRNGQTFVNTYVPVEVPRRAGDVTPFLQHLARILPDERDQRILLSYMAACVQHQGYKFQWAPLIQGTEGNGKTLLTRCVANAVGQRYTHWANAADLDNKFNAWMVGKVFFAVEDINVSESKREIMEALKPMITGGDGFQITAKGVDAVTEDICGNFMFNSNHRTAIRVNDNSRRFCIFYTAQQNREDVLRDGMGGDYFPALYRWLNAEGYAMVSEFLYTYKIAAEFNPAGDCQRAPESSTSHEAVAESKGNVEQEIENSIAEGRPGFCGDFISYHQLRKLLEETHTKIGHSACKDMLKTIGYVPHPMLPEGRTNNPVIPDSKRTFLYVKKGSLASQMTSPSEIAKHYEKTNAVQFPFAKQA